MADIREQILARLVVVCQGVTGIAAVARNKLDVPGLVRPAVLINGGAEQLLTRHERARFSQVQLMDLTPQVLLLVRADDGNEAGTLLSLYRNRVVAAVLDDGFGSPVSGTLRELVTTNGGIRYEGCAEPELTPESKEPRLELQFVFTYPLKLSDLAA